MEPADVVRAYGEAWLAPDEGRRKELLEQAWVDDGVYCDPMTTVSGRDGVLAAIGSFMDRNAGHRIVLTTAVDAHDGYARFGWERRDASGTLMNEGMDFAVFGPDGRISRIVGFFGSLAPASAQRG